MSGESVEHEGPEDGAPERVAEDTAGAPAVDVAPREGADADDPEACASDAGATGDADSDAADAPPDAADAPPLRTTLEAVLFAAAEPVPLARLVRLLGAWPRAAVHDALEELRAALDADGRGIRLAETGGGFQLRSAAECAPWVRRFFAEKPPRLSRAVLETLAIVAYRQPATRGEVEAVRGVNCDAVLGALLTRGLIQVVGRRQSPGRPVEYGTTGNFLELFSLRDLTELPELPEPAALARLIEEADAERAEGGDDAEADAGDGGEGAEGAPGSAPAGDRDAASDEDDGADAHRALADGADAHRALAEDPEPGRGGFAAGGGGPDPGRTGPGERSGGGGARDPGGSDPGPDHG